MYCITVILGIRMPYLSIKVIYLIYYKMITEVHISLLLKGLFSPAAIIKKSVKISMYYFHSDTYMQLAVILIPRCSIDLFKSRMYPIIRI